MLLELAQEPAELLGETGQPRARAKDLKFRALFGQDRPQQHDPSLLVQQPWRNRRKLGEEEIRETFKRKNLQAGVSGKIGIRQQLPFQLKGGLFRGQEHERRPLRRRSERGADFLQATVGLAAACRSQEETHVHGDVLSSIRQPAKEQRTKK